MPPFEDQLFMKSVVPAPSIPTTVRSIVPVVLSLFLLVAANAVVASAESDQQSSIVAAPSFTCESPSETVEPRVPLSLPGSRRGFLALSDVHAFDGNQLFVILPPIRDARVCFDVFSRNGQYRSSFSCRIKNAQTGRYLVPRQPDRLNVVNGLSDEDLGIVAYLATGPCDVERSPVFVPASFTAGVFGRRYRISLMVGDDRASLYWKERNQWFDCRRLGRLHSVTYNTLCDFDLPADADAATLIIVRDGHGRPPEVRMDVRVPVLRNLR